MALNFIWIGFFLIAFLSGLYQWLIGGDAGVFNRIVEDAFSMAKTGFEVALGLTGVLTLMLGIMKIGERAGAVAILAKLVDPLFRRLFPGVPSGHPAQGSILMNFAANMLGLDNAATPMGLKAMKELQELNPDKETASDAQILFLVLNASGLTLIPVSIIAYRTQMGAANPTDIFLPLLLSTFFSTLGGLFVTSLFQNVQLRHPVTIAWLMGLTAAVFGTLWYFAHLTETEMGRLSSLIAGLALFGLIVGFLLLAMIRKIPAWDSFIEGAKEGFQTAVMVIPYLVGILVGIAVFRSSGAMDLLLAGVSGLVSAVGLPTDFVGALPTALMKPLSGSGARGMMVEAMKTYGPDSFVGRLSCIFQGAADTTFYVIAVYFGSVGIRKTRHAIICGLAADLVGFIAAILIAYLFFGKGL
ncbi:MAG TPA: nucleoside recognition domain-containing protein [Fibrobacteraceae bacterium]|nr:nucleoside recognition domain-containing protein [Fibrobacteraceae bacterium]